MKLQPNREEYFTDATNTDHILKHYLHSKDIDTTDLWHIKYHSETGRGVYATKDIPVNTIIFMDHALIMGPRFSANCKPLCTVCYKEDVNLQICEKQCGLPVCSKQCAGNEIHVQECTLIGNWIEKSERGPFTEWSVNLKRALVPIRAAILSADNIEVLSLLQGHNSFQNAGELKLIRTSGIQLTEDEEEFILDVCKILNTNAFEAIYESDTKVSLRGLYPVAALLNHNCCPNTTHLYDKQGRMIVKSVREIKEGEEITNTYTNLLWGTVTRRHNLFMTKRFWCYCDRCKDLNEFGYPLSALYCTDINNCNGLMLPKETTDVITVPWVCNICGKKCSSKQIGIFQSTLSSVVNPYYSDTIENLINFLQNRIHLSIPNCNQLIVDLKLRVVGLLGHQDGYFWNDLSDDRLEYKEKLCRELLNILEILQLGENKMKGFLKQELYLTLVEKCQRKNEEITKEIDDLKAQLND